jgi:hypothetical protein
MPLTGVELLPVLSKISKGNERALKSSYHIPSQVVVDLREKLVSVWCILQMEAGSFADLIGIVDCQG